MLLDTGHQHVLTLAGAVFHFVQHVADVLGGVELTGEGAAVAEQTNTGADGEVVLDELLTGDEVATAEEVPGRDLSTTDFGVVDAYAEGQRVITSYGASSELVPGVIVLPGGELSARNGANTQQSHGQYSLFHWGWIGFLWSWTGQK